MNHIELRQKYPKFIYEKYEHEIVNGNLEIKYFFSIPPDHNFVHKLTIKNCKLEFVNFDNLIFHIGLSIMPSYWKATCSPTIELTTNNLQLTTDQISFWHKLFIRGMGEYFYKNHIDFTYKNFLTIRSDRASKPPAIMPPEQSEGAREDGIAADHVIVPMGGGKDSIVTMELLKPHFNVVPFVINPAPVMTSVISTAKLDKFISVSSLLDPHLLELNDSGYLNGHVPITAFYSMVAVTAAALNQIPFIAFSNERSSNEGNTEYLDHIINHQYSKSLEYETDFHNYVHKYLSPALNYFSFLRPVYDLQISKIFCTFPQYFPVFSSCNQNFKFQTNNQQLTTNNLWCTHCPKCVSTALLLAAWMGRDKVVEMMGVYPPDLTENIPLVEELTGKRPVKPFDCVLTREEANLALDLIASGLTEKSQLFLTSWLDNPNMPEQFAKILKSAI
jgi:UDP-N-acetyl-alpha-D-muramoyl-L-alanyl-L-glutamate epimerase